MAYKSPALSYFEWQQPVIDKDLSVPPGGETKGDRYLIYGVGAGDWAGEDGNIATYNGAGWDFTDKKEGMYVFVKDENVLYLYIAAWAPTSDLKVKYGTFTRDMTAGTGIVAYAGIGFPPKAVIFTASLTGFSKSDGFSEATSRGCTYVYGAAPTYGEDSTSYSLILREEAGKYQLAYVNVWGADGFSLAWTKGGLPAAGNGRGVFLAIG